MTPQELLTAAKTQALLLRIAIAAIEQAQNYLGPSDEEGNPAYPDAEHPEAILVEVEEEP